MKLTWPKNAPIKGGFMRDIYQHQLPLIKYFCKFPINPFLKLTQQYLNSFLMRRLSCTMRSARHCGAFIILEEEKSVGAVAQGLGHSSIISTIYYIDPWAMPIPFEQVSNRLLQLLRKGKVQWWSFLWAAVSWDYLFYSFICYQWQHIYIDYLIYTNVLINISMHLQTSTVLVVKMVIYKWASNI